MKMNKMKTKWKQTEQNKKMKKKKKLTTKLIKRKQAKSKI